LIYPFAFAVLLLYINAPRQMDAIPLVTAVRWWFGPDVFMLQASYFFAGATYYAYRRRIVVRRAFFVCATLGVLLASLVGVQLLVLPLAVPYTVLWLALRLPTRHVERYGDISYGLYIYGWPVMQILVLLGVARLGPVPLAVASIVVTVPFALLSWRYVEAPCMHLKRGRRFLARRHTYGPTATTISPTNDAGRLSPSLPKSTRLTSVPGPSRQRYWRS